MNELSQRKCVPCRGDTPTLSAEAISEYIKVVPGWSFQGGVIDKTFFFKNFKQALIFFNKVAVLAEEEGHHPNMCIHDYKKVKLTLTTHVVYGLTENDFVMATKINELE